LVRRGWDDLSPAYRGRLVAGGVTADAYSRGGSLTAARGHLATPERPAQAVAAPGRFGDYVERAYPELVVRGNPPPLEPGWYAYTGSSLAQAIEYADAIGNPEYIKAYLLDDGTVVLTVNRPR
jgi:hypothetical protein